MAWFGLVWFFFVEPAETGALRQPAAAVGHGRFGLRRGAAPPTGRPQREPADHRRTGRHRRSVAIFFPFFVAFVVVVVVVVVVVIFVNSLPRSIPVSRKTCMENPEWPSSFQNHSDDEFKDWSKFDDQFLVLRLPFQDLIRVAMAGAAQTILAIH